MKNELVSALLDGECSPLEVRSLLEQIGDSPELLQHWSRLNLVRDALAARPFTRAAQADANAFCAGVMAQLGEMEPASAASANPAPANRMPDQSSRARVVSLPARPREASPRRARRSRPLAGWAAAASVTVVALAGGRAWIGGGAAPDSESSLAKLAAVNRADSTQPVATSGEGRSGLVPVSTRSLTASNAEPSEVRWGQLDPDTARELNSYMIEHNNSRAEQGMSGELAYARLATRNVGYRPAEESR